MNMKKYLIPLCLAVMLGGCKTFPEGRTSYDWGAHGPTFYPNEQYAAPKLARRCGFEWGMTSSAYHPSSAEYKMLREKELNSACDPHDDSRY